MCAKPLTHTNEVRRCEWSCVCTELVVVFAKKIDVELPLRFCKFS